jgi:hypothetical protein
MLKKPPKSVVDKTAIHVRVFKTTWFAKEARKAKISDGDLCRAIEQVIQGQSDDLGGGVFKKRLNDNMHRSIIVAKAGRYWIYTYLYAKKDRANITVDELAGFKKLAKDYGCADDNKFAALLRNKELMEICHGD